MASSLVLIRYLCDGSARGEERQTNEREKKTVRLECADGYLCSAALEVFCVCVCVCILLLCCYGREE